MSIFQILTPSALAFGNLEGTASNPRLDVVFKYFNQVVLQGLSQVVLTILVFVVIVIIGWIVAWALSYVLRKLVEVLKIDEGLTKLGFRAFIEKGGLHLNSGVLVEKIVFWVTLVAFLMAGFDLVGLSRVNDFLKQLINYIPAVIAAAFILVASLYLGELLARWIKGWFKAADLKGGAYAGAIGKWAIILLGIIAALTQLGIAREVWQILLMGVVTMLAIAGGLAFGLGGQETAREILEKIKREIHQE